MIRPLPRFRILTAVLAMAIGIVPLVGCDSGNTMSAEDQKNLLHPDKSKIKKPTPEQLKPGAHSFSSLATPPPGGHAQGVPGAGN
jgi:hypothetical protein